MSAIELVVDEDVVSFMFRRRALGNAYSQLIGPCRTGITWLTIAESRQGIVYRNWGSPRIAALDAFLSRFFVVRANSEIANICGGLLGRAKQIGRVISWPDAWAAATAIWLDVPLVTHDRDLEKIPGLRVLTMHADWQVREEGAWSAHSKGVWLGEQPDSFPPAVSEQELQRRAISPQRELQQPTLLGRKFPLTSRQRHHDRLIASE